MSISSVCNHAHSHGRRLQFDLRYTPFLSSSHPSLFALSRSCLLVMKSSLCSLCLLGILQILLEAEDIEQAFRSLIMLDWSTSQVSSLFYTIWAQQSVSGTRESDGQVELAEQKRTPAQLRMERISAHRVGVIESRPVPRSVTRGRTTPLEGQEPID